MEVVAHRERRTRREMSPDRAKMARIMRPTFKKVQVVYYLSRNGHLEHPHYVEVTHLAHQPLRLKDIMERLTVLRGKGMPSLYSWSCKRSYKNGYVWNDLAENDVIVPSEGGEYVLKGSELLLSNCTDKLHHLQIGNNVQELHLVPKGKFLASQQHPHEEQEYEEKPEYTTCSRGVSTDEIQEFKQKKPEKNTPNELILESNSFSSPPSTTSSSTLSDGDPVGNEPMLSRNSMLFSLIACGGSGSFRKNVPPGLPPCAAARKSCSGGNFHKGVVCKAAAAKAGAVAEEEDEMIRYMSENPRFGNLQAEEKEYFSGSIVERMNAEEKRFGGENGLKRSSSYNQERSTKVGLGEVVEEEEVKKEKGVKGKCIPRKKKSSSKQTLKK